MPRKPPFRKEKAAEGIAEKKGPRKRRRPCHRPKRPLQNFKEDIFADEKKIRLGAEKKKGEEEPLRTRFAMAGKREELALLKVRGL